MKIFGEGALRRGVCALVALIGLVVGPLGAPASAGPLPTCEATVTEDTVLTADLSCPTGNGLVVGAAGITLDLGGHRLSGSLTGAGITNSGFDGVEVTNGSISGFAVAVSVSSAERNWVHDLRVSIAPGDLTGGIILEASDDSVVEGNRLTGGGNGILLLADPNSTADGADRNIITDNVMRSVVQGITLESSGRNRVVRNTIRGGGGGVVLGVGSSRNIVATNVATGGLTGIYVDPFSNLENLIAANVANGHSSAGIFLDSGTSTSHLVGNRTNRNFVGIEVKAPATTITANVANNNSSQGIDAVDGVTDGGGNLAIGNAEPQCVNVVCGSG